MTIEQIREEIAELKPCSLVQTRRYVRQLKIKPVGARQKPQLYPNDAAEKIILHLGLYDGILTVREAKRIARRKAWRRK